MHTFPSLCLSINRASELINKIKKRKKKDVADPPIVDPEQTKKFRATLNEEFKYVLFQITVIIRQQIFSFQRVKIFPRQQRYIIEVDWYCTFIIAFYTLFSLQLGWYATHDDTQVRNSRSLYPWGKLVWIKFINFHMKVVLKTDMHQKGMLNFNISGCFATRCGLCTS